MTYLSQLTPAEVYILTKDNVTHREFLKITFIDLLLKQVLKTFEVQRQPHIRQEIRTYKYIGVGPNFKNYPSKDHEQFFLSTFEKDNTIEMLFRNLVKIGYQKSRTLSHFKRELIKTPTLERCFSQNLFQRIFNGYSFTEYGKEVKRKVEKEIQDLNTELAALKNIENQKAIELIKTIGGNIFLLESVDYALLNQIDSDLATEMSRKETTIDGSGGGSGGCGWSFDDYSSSFDSGCSSDSGCGGNSGCGGGCSGCGGCGGD